MFVSCGQNGVRFAGDQKIIGETAGKSNFRLDSHFALAYSGDGDRGLAQLVEHRSPKPRVVGSSPSAPANFQNTEGQRCTLLRAAFKVNF